VDATLQVHVSDDEGEVTAEFQPRCEKTPWAQSPRRFVSRYELYHLGNRTVLVASDVTRTSFSGRSDILCSSSIKNLFRF
jgi:hypothetical protein